MKISNSLSLDDHNEGDEARDEDGEREASEGEVEGGDEDGGQGKQEYVKKEFYARSYVSPYGNETENAVRGCIVKNSRYDLSHISDSNKDLS